MIKLTALLLFFSLAGVSHAGEGESVLLVKRAFENFEYRNVIRLADSVLVKDSLLSAAGKIEILLMKSVSHFSLAEENQAKKSFIEILNINRDYTPDSTVISPKIVALFQTVKEDYIAIKPPETKVKQEPGQNVSQPNTSAGLLNTIEKYRIYNSAVTRSLLFPGWGHIMMGQQTKGIVIASVSGAALGSLIYYSFKSASDEEEYLSAVTREDISSTYKTYNTSYRLRNIFIGIFAAAWLYAQGDLIFAGEPGGVNYSLDLLPDGAKSMNSARFVVKVPF